MKKRFTLFLYGFIAGIILIILMYGSRSKTLFDWTPEGRVLKRLRMTEKIISDSMQCILDCNSFTSEQFELLLDDGDVNFARARTKPDPIYSVSFDDEVENDLKFTFRATDSTSVLIEVSGGIEGCECP